MNKTKVLIADDHTLFRRLLAGMLAGEKDIEVIGQAESGSDAVRKARELQPDLVLMDLRMPGDDGVEATRAITQEMPDTSVLMLTISDEDEDLVAAMKAGARGYLLKDIEPADLIGSIRLTTAGHTVVHPTMLPKLVEGLGSVPKRERQCSEAIDNSGLTEREKEILCMVANGATNRAIADIFDITETTVKAHVHSILRKLHLNNRVQAAKWAMDNYLI